MLSIGWCSAWPLLVPGWSGANKDPLLEIKRNFCGCSVNDMFDIELVVDADRKLTARGCGQQLRLVYAESPRLSRYSMELNEPTEILMRFSF